MNRRIFIKAILGTAGIALLNPIKLLSAESNGSIRPGHWAREIDYSEVIKNEDSLVNINRNQLRLRIRKDITKILQAFSYEPNNESTRKAIASTVADYLEHLNAVFIIERDYYAVVHESSAVDVTVNMKNSKQIYCFVDVEK